MFSEKNKNKTPIIIKTTDGIIMEIVIRFFEKIAPKITETPAKETKTGHKVFISNSLKQVSTITKNKPPKVKNKPMENLHIEYLFIQAKYKTTEPTKVIITERKTAIFTLVFWIKKICKRIPMIINANPIAKRILCIFLISGLPLFFITIEYYKKGISFKLERDIGI